MLIRKVIVLLFSMTMLGCQDPSGTTFRASKDLEADNYSWDLPPHIPLPVVPTDNPMSEQKFQLGRHLFYDKRLSGNGTQSCSSCHDQAKAFSDGRSVAIGSTGILHPRNAMGLTNAAYVPTLTWANPNLRLLENQLLLPLFGEHPVEQGITDATLPDVQQRLQADPLYDILFAEAFPGGVEFHTKEQIVKALAVFVRGLTSFNSPFDRFQRGDPAALSASALRGQSLFFGEKMECFHCHGGYNLSDSTLNRSMTFIERPFHNTGLFNIGGRGEYPESNRGVFEITAKASDMGKFRAVSLRNIELTAPYMHDGSMATLAEVIDFYAAGGRNITVGAHAGDGRKNPFKDGFITGFTIDDTQKLDLIEFLNSLTDQDFIDNPRFANPWPEQ